MSDWLAEGCPDELVIKPPPPGVPVNALAATQILLDLIAELREAHQRTGSESVKGPWCDPCALPWPCHTIQSADCAEARLAAQE